MKVEVLGCSGGIGRGHRTTCFLVDDDLLIDCGSGAGELTLARMGRLETVFLTHSHLDHIGFLPFLVDTAFELLRDKPLTVYLQPATLEVLRKHIFNWSVWPDFTTLPDPDNPVLRFELIEPGQRVTIGGRTIEAIEVSHTVPAVGYRVESAEGAAFAYTGDSTGNDTFWQGLNAHSRLDYVFAECSFPDRHEALAHSAGHYHASLLASDLGKLRLDARIAITHMTPALEAEILDELRQALPDRPLRALARGEIITL